MFTLNDVHKIMERVELQTGVELNLGLKQNNRLQRALARCISKVTTKNGVRAVTPVRLEFGKTILNVQDREIFEQIVLHELAHAVANKKHNDNCGHGKRFKAVCKQIGCYNTNEQCEAEFMEAIKKAEANTKGTDKTKYTVTCQDCGKTYNYKRDCQVLKDIRNQTGVCSCGKCNSKALVVKQNF
jgi:predicted SprT family Zn-dependent metalloprotease